MEAEWELAVSGYLIRSSYLAWQTRLVGGDSLRSAEYQVVSLPGQRPAQGFSILPEHAHHTGHQPPRLKFESGESLSTKIHLLSFPQRIRKSLLCIAGCKLILALFIPICHSSAGKQIKCDRSSLAAVECSWLVVYFYFLGGRLPCSLRHLSSV